MVKNEIKVFARLRPELKRRNVVNYEIHRRPRKHVEEDYLVLWGAQKSGNEFVDNRPESWNFAFHKIFDHGARQDEVFEDVAKPIIQSVLNGYNATIFAYGQTGSGKTFSITGDSEEYEDRGILPRTIQHLFQTIQKNPENLYSVEIAYLEIYNENGYDLLDPKHEVVTKLEDLPRVTIQEDEAGRLHLKNLSFRVVENEKDALALLFLGDTKRAIAETPMNPQSSRSHCIFTIVVTVRQYGAEKYLKKAKMHLVDLAGSERVYKCCISGSILTEAKHINLSLHYLEQVIVCLGQQNVSHIPYRNSLLTAILRDSLGGNCLTTMLATLSINKSNLEETISTCRFSQRVALIRNDVKLVLERNAEDENKFLKMEVERLRNQLALLTEQPKNEELTPSEKQDLDYQVEKFLQSDFATIDWKNDERKIRYCLNTLRSKLRSRNGKTNCSIGDDNSAKDVDYYRNLVIQRDKEICDLRRRMSDPQILNGAEIQTLHKVLQDEQSRLSNNLSLLKSLKSEVTDLRSVSPSVQQEQSTFETCANAVENLVQDSDPSAQRDSEDLFTPVQALTLERSQPNDEDQETKKVSESLKPLRKAFSEPGKVRRKMKVSDFLSNECLKLNENVDKREASEGSDFGHVGKPADEPKASRSSGSNWRSLKDSNQRIPIEGDNFGAISTGESSIRAEASLAMSSFLPPKFLQDLLKSVKDSEHEKREENVNDPEIPSGWEFSKGEDSSWRKKSCLGSISTPEQRDEKDLAEPAGEFRAQPEIPNPNESLQEDDDFVKSLPLTGDPEIDKEIIAFYRAKRSGGTYL
ncbi:kinesin-like protein KIF6 [Diprion similis]|uniref:kinesin-like protein KIF6 n=1 Tax=Diprion similis TaxID=362088 RepID=UPI001EF7C05E|nr:kinesin-like protein KIF6 [Diprion similis]